MEDKHYSHSLLKRLKTEHNSYKPSEKNTLYDNKYKSRTPSSKIATGSSCVKSILNRLQNGNKKYCNDKPQKIIIQDRDDFVIVCMNHATKIATFEQKQSMMSAYCDQCAIKLVKNGHKLMKMSQRSLRLRAIYDEEYEKIAEMHKKSSFLIADYYQTMYEQLKNMFVSAKTNEQQRKLELLKFYQPLKNKQELTNGLKPFLGYLKTKKFQIIWKQNHQLSIPQFPNKIQDSPISNKNDSMTFRKYSQIQFNQLNKQNKQPNLQTCVYQQKDTPRYNIANLQTLRQRHINNQNDNDEISQKSLKVSKWKKKCRIDSLKIAVNLQSSQ